MANYGKWKKVTETEYEFTYYFNKDTSSFMISIPIDVDNKHVVEYYDR